MAILTLPTREPGTNVDSLSIELDLSNNAEELVIIIKDKYPEVGSIGGSTIFIPRKFKYSIDELDLVETTTYGERFIDPDNDSGQRKVLYHFDIDIDEFVVPAGTAFEIFSVEIYTVDEDADVLLYSFEIRKEADAGSGVTDPVEIRFRQLESRINDLQDEVDELRDSFNAGQGTTTV